MGADRELLDALTRAVAADPDNPALRLHLAELLLDSGDGQSALEHCATVLARFPDRLDALELGARTATAVGDDSRAAAWARLHDALTGHAPDCETQAQATPLPDRPAPQVSAGASPALTDGDGHDETAHDWDSWLEGLVELSGHQPVTLADVGGLVDVKRSLDRAFLGPLRNPEIRRAYGKSLRGGLLLWGPPGCGKTFLARALAGELGASFLPVGLNDILDMWLGQSERNMHEMFAAARRAAPCVLFFDEVDAIGHRRSDLNRQAGRNVVAQLLAELDGVDAQNEGLFVLGATNQPWDVDPALRRPGRFDRTVLVLPPDVAARRAILELHVRNRPTIGLDLAEVTRRTEGFSGADLAGLCESATALALEASIEQGDVRPITMNEFTEALRNLRPSTGAWFDVAQNYVTYANQGGEYDELRAYVSRRGR